MSAKKREIGSELDAYCTKCKIDRIHVIETLKSDGNINRVMCRTCDGVHLYRRPKADAGKKTTKRPRKGAITAADAENAKAYAMDGIFEVGDILKHKKFGLGSVRVVRPGGRMEVRFEEEGDKLMVCGDPGRPAK